MSDYDNIINFYKLYLEDINIFPQNDGKLICKIKEKEAEFKIKLQTDTGSVTRNVYLPLKALTSAEDAASRAYFHPACENPIRPVSAIVSILTTMTRLNIEIALTKCIYELLLFCADKDTHDSASMEQVEEILQRMPAVTAPTCVSWNKTISSLKPNVEPFSTLRINSQSTERETTLSFPLFSPEKDFYGIKLTKKAKEAFNAAFMIVIGEHAVKAEKNISGAPNFTALCKLQHKVMMRIQKIYSILKPKDPPLYKGEWFKDLDKLNDWYRSGLNLQLDGNIGFKKNESGVKVTETQTKPAVSPIEKKDGSRIGGANQHHTATAGPPSQSGYDGGVPDHIRASLNGHNGYMNPQTAQQNMRWDGRRNQYIPSPTPQQQPQQPNYNTGYVQNNNIPQGYQSQAPIDNVVMQQQQQINQLQQQLLDMQNQRMQTSYNNLGSRYTTQPNSNYQNDGKAHMTLTPL